MSTHLEARPNFQVLVSLALCFGRSLFLSDNILAHCSSCCRFFASSEATATTPFSANRPSVPSGLVHLLPSVSLVFVSLSCCPVAQENSFTSRPTSTTTLSPRRAMTTATSAASPSRPSRPRDTRGSRRRRRARAPSSPARPRRPPGRLRRTLRRTRTMRGSSSGRRRSSRPSSKVRRSGSG